MSHPKTEGARPKAIERFIIGATLGLVMVAAGQAALSAAYGQFANHERAVENARDDSVNSKMLELAVLQKQIQLEIVQVQQFLTDVSATRGLNGMDDGWSEAEANAQAFGRDVDRAQALAHELKAEELAGALAAVKDKFPNYYSIGQGMAHDYVNGGAEIGNATMPRFDAASSDLAGEVERAAKSLKTVQDQMVIENERHESGLAKQQNMAVVVYGIIALGAGVWGMMLIARLRRRVLRPLGDLANYMGFLAEGDYERPIPLKASNDELGHMVKSVGVFREAALERKAARLQQEDDRSQAETAKARHDAERRQADAQRAEVVATVASALSHLSDGDLTARIDADLAAEYAALKADFNAASERLASTITQIRESAGSVGVGADEIAAAADDLSRRTEHQAASLEETAAALDEITATVKKTAASAIEAQARVAETHEEARTTEQAVSAAVTKVGEIEASSSKIGQIIGVIDEIAFQTNLLALNAGVEAARAGEAGRGFAVVAAEVRALAQRSAGAAKEIKTLIGESSQRVSEGVQLVGQAGGALTRILERVGGISVLVQEISATAKEQSLGLSEVNTAVNQMDQVTQQNAAMVEETTAAAHSLKGQAQVLDQLVSAFRLPGREQVARRRAA
ncbi:methyl-accepting chemotaxis protein [Phenylobacterium aquaticum]|uniref:methyl-accepting chemotaxis protein n=1 Tax=Phenylobacterium aquaticum TaxID=1763816 RepID=UPI0026EC6C7F|nr:methyl-accepting chemotaxis protein [Phenylobacterium aquaticum]